MNQTFVTADTLKMKILFYVVIMTILSIKYHSVSGKIIGFVKKRVLVGETASLPCNLSLPSINDNITLVLWYKGSSQVPIFTYDERIATKDVTLKQFMPHEWRGRLRFQTDYNPAVLILENVMASDDSEYRCKIDYHHSKSVTFKISLSVIVPPSPPVITDSQGRILSETFGPHNEGEQLKLICSAFDGNPSPAVTWWKESIILSKEYSAKQGGVVVNELIIPRLSRNDLHREISCRASNNNITKPAATKVILELNLRPLDVKITSDRREFSANNIVQLTCESSGSRPPAVITWWKGSEKMKNTKTNSVSDSNISQSVLTFTPSEEDNGKFISCRADNPNIPRSALENGWKLNITYVPIVSVQISDQVANEGATVFLECHVIANPSVADIKWYFNGKHLSKEGKSSGIDTPSLLLKNVDRTNIGNYSCAATNSEGTRESSKFKLVIKYRPVCRNQELQIVGAALKEGVQLNCGVWADPDDVEFHWSFNNSLFQREINSFIAHGTESRLEIRPQTLSDYGIFLCLAQNEIGSQDNPCRFKVVQAGPPDSPTNCTVQNRTSDTISVMCLSGYNGGLNQTFIMEVYDESGKSFVANFSSNSKPTFVARHLQTGTLFTIAIFASNAKGQSERFIISSRTLGQVYFESGRRLLIPINLVLGILIAIVLFCIFTSVILMRLLKTRQRPRPRKESGENKSSRLKQPEVYLPSDVSLSYSDDKNPDIIPHVGNKYDDDCQVFHITPSTDSVCSAVNKDSKELSRSKERIPSFNSFIDDSRETRYSDILTSKSSLRIEEMTDSYWINSNNSSTKGKHISSLGNEDDVQVDTPLMSFQCHSESAV